ncbi:hypothetical protein ACMFMF_010417 [Clarireedia jacksonii]
MSMSMSMSEKTEIQDPVVPLPFPPISSATTKSLGTWPKMQMNDEISRAPTGSCYFAISIFSLCLCSASSIISHGSVQMFLFTDSNFVQACIKVLHSLWVSSAHTLF